MIDPASRPVQSEAMVCRKAAELLRTRGFTQHSLIDYEGALCFTGALLVALGGKDFEDYRWGQGNPDPEDNTKPVSLWQAINPQYPRTLLWTKDPSDPQCQQFLNIIDHAYLLLDGDSQTCDLRDWDPKNRPGSLVTWNNVPERTIHDVTSLLSRCAGDLERKY